MFTSVDFGMAHSGDEAEDTGWTGDDEREYDDLRYEKQLAINCHSLHTSKPYTIVQHINILTRP